MKKKISRQQDIKSIPFSSYESCTICRWLVRKNCSLFHKNYQLIANTINYEMQRPTYLSTINKIVQSNIFINIKLEQPSKQLIVFQQIEKNLQFQEFLKQYFRLDKTQSKIKILIQKHLPNVKANYMDFKIKNFLILNKYRVTEKANLPYPLSNKFQKQTDSKMSSTKSVQNKILQQIEKQMEEKIRYKSPSIKQQKFPNKKNRQLKKKSNQNFQIKELTKSIGQMIQNIQDNRALERFKKEMQKSSKLNCGVHRLLNQQLNDNVNFQKKNKSNNHEKSQNQLKFLKQKQFKRRVDNDMIKHFPQQKNQSLSMKKKSSFSKHKNPYGFLINKNKSKSKSNYNATQRLQTNPQPEVQQYGLSIIRQRRKKSKSRNEHSKSKNRSSRKSKQSIYSNHLAEKRLQTEYQNVSTQRLNTGQSALTKSKSSSRIPTQYDSSLIIKHNKQKPVPNFQNEMLFSNFNKVKSSSKHSIQSFKSPRASKSKSKKYLFQFNCSSKGQAK